MELITGKDIVVHINDSVVANVQSYSTESKREYKTFTPYNNDLEEVQICEKIIHTLSLEKLVYSGISRNNDIPSLYDLSDFTFTVVLPDKEIHFAGCEWIELKESVSKNNICVDYCKIIAKRRWVLLKSNDDANLLSKSSQILERSVYSHDN